MGQAGIPVTNGRSVTLQNVTSQLKSMQREILLASALLFLTVAVVGANDADPGGEGGVGQTPATEYHTPLAGEEQDLAFLGRPLHVPARNRDNNLAITLGGIFFHPRLGGEDALPFAALYWRHCWEKTRARAVVAVFQNEVDVARSLEKFELLGHFDNNTNPFSQAEIVNGQEVKESSIVWGTFSGWLGAGVRWPVAPFQSDNDLRLQVFYQAGYLYSERVADTGSRVRLPPRTPSSRGCGSGPVMTVCDAICWNFPTRGGQGEWIWS